MIKPRITVVVPTHQRPELLRRTLGSLQRQTLPPRDFEVVVVATAGDPGIAVAEEFRRDERLTLSVTSIPHDPTEGRSASAKRNHGVSLARGEWIAFTDDDCVADARWLEAVIPFFDDPRHGAVEGQKRIPPPSAPTLTYKGLLLFTKPGGYQTANMFYRRDLFLECGGFDLGFPFYLEDTDLAWTVIDRGYRIPHAPDALVEHPVPTPAPWRLLDGAVRSRLVVRLASKHPQLFRERGWKILSHLGPAYLALELGAVGAAIAGRRHLAVACSAATLALTLANSYRMFRGCRVEAEELLVTAMLLPVVPPVALVQGLRGMFENGTWTRLW